MKDPMPCQANTHENRHAADPFRVTLDRRAGGPIGHGRNRTTASVQTRVLNRAARRNARRFPADFAFRPTRAEKAEVITNCDHLAHLRYSPALPVAFTEHGALMAASM